jgi:RecJ-like exonuclease
MRTKCHTCAGTGFAVVWVATTPAAATHCPDCSGTGQRTRHQPAILRTEADLLTDLELVATIATCRRLASRGRLTNAADRTRYHRFVTELRSRQAGNASAPA